MLPAKDSITAIAVILSFAKSPCYFDHLAHFCDDAGHAFHLFVLGVGRVRLDDVGVQVRDGGAREVGVPKTEHNSAASDLVFLGEESHQLLQLCPGRLCNFSHILDVLLVNKEEVMPGRRVGVHIARGEPMLLIDLDWILVVGGQVLWAEGAHFVLLDGFDYTLVGVPWPRIPHIYKFFCWASHRNFPGNPYLYHR